jgi:hypothetical protein
MKNGLLKEAQMLTSDSSNNDKELTLEQRSANNAHKTKAIKRDMTRHAFLAKKMLLSITKRVDREFGRTQMVGTSHCDKTQNYGNNLLPAFMFQRQDKEECSFCSIACKKNAAGPLPSPAQPIPVAAKCPMTTFTPMTVPVVIPAFAPDKTELKYANLNANNLKGVICA